MPPRFAPPPASPGALARDALLAALEQDQECGIVLLLAPAGYGKTTLMQQYMERLCAQHAGASWLTLDARDNDPVQLMADLDNALRLGLAGHAPTRGADVDTPAQQWPAWLEQQAPDGPRHTLFLDEFEQLSAEPALQLLTLLTKRLPRALRLVIGSRAKPALGLERLRLRGQLHELTASELRFEPAETRRFFNGRLDVPLSAWLIEQLQAITGGWPAALQLTALAARSRSDLERYAADLSGGLAHIADYLSEDVLQAQSAPLRAFLLETCQLPRLCAPACNAATGRADGAAMLDYLERHGLFTSALDAGRSWFAYHPLFAQFLQNQQAHMLAPERVRACQRGAAHWFARHGAAGEAADLWLLAGDSAAALEAMSACVHELVLQAQFSTIVRWLERLDPHALTNAGPELMLGAAWACGFTGDGAQALAWLARLNSARPAGTERDRIDDELMALAPILLATGGDTAGALALGLAHWQTIDRAHRFAVGALANVIAYCLMVDGQYASAQQFCFDAREANEAIGSALGLGYALSVAGLIEASQGKLTQALEHFDKLDKMAALALQQPWCAPAHLKIASVSLIAAVLLETDRLDQADELLQRYFPLVAQQPSVDMLMLCHLVYARLKLARDDVDGAHAILNAAERRAASTAWPAARTHHIIEAERIRIALAGGDSERALARGAALERAGADLHAKPAGSFVEEWCGAGIDTARLAIARGAVAQARDQLDDAIAQAQATGRRWRLLKLLLLRALAEDGAGDETAAHATLCAALELGWQIGARRSFLDEGPRLCALLTQLPASALAKREHAHEILAYWRALCGAAPDAAASAPGAVVLSEREHAILDLLATGMGNDQLAGTVFLSVNTVKWHIRRILEKLGARNRSEAVFIATRLGLLAK